MVVSIAINITIGSIIVALRLPIYVDCSGRCWSACWRAGWRADRPALQPHLVAAAQPGGAGPFTAFAPVAMVIGLMAGWASRGVFSCAPTTRSVASSPWPPASPWPRSPSSSSADHRHPGALPD
jgi:hypothetical protein